MHPLNILLNILEFVAFFTGLFYLKKVKQSSLKGFILLLGFICFSEVIGKFLKYFFSSVVSNSWYVYFVIPIQYIMYLILFAFESKKSRSVYLSGVMIFLYLLLLFLEIILNNSHSLFSYSYMFGTLFLLIVIFNYLYSIIKTADIFNFKSNPYFYISIGLLIFYIGTFPYWGLHNYLWTKYKFIGNNYWYIAMSLNCIMYCMFTISFLCNNKQKSISL